jgi:hypothetical protein
MIITDLTLNNIFFEYFTVPIEYLVVAGGGGGGGRGGGAGNPVSTSATTGGFGARYGGGGGGAGATRGPAFANGRAGAAGVIIITYFPGVSPIGGTTNFFLLF